MVAIETLRSALIDKWNEDIRLVESWVAPQQWPGCIVMATQISNYERFSYGLEDYGIFFRHTPNRSSLSAAQY